MVENNNNSINNVFNTGGRDNLMEDLGSAVILQRSTTATNDSNLNQGFVFESATQNSTELPLDDDEKEIGGLRPSTPTDYPPDTTEFTKGKTGHQSYRFVIDSHQAKRMESLGSRLKLCWIESSP